MQQTIRLTPDQKAVTLDALMKLETVHLEMARKATRLDQQKRHRLKALHCGNAYLRITELAPYTEGK